MNNRLLLLLIIALFPLTLFSQIKKKIKNQGVYAATALNFYPKQEAYSFFSEFYFKRDQINLNFLTVNSGTFIVERDSGTLVERVHSAEAPSQLFNLGASVQIIGWKHFFHEISLTKLSFSRSALTTDFKYVDTLGNTVRLPSHGYDQKAGAIGLRYEVGKYFGKNRKAPVKFGLSGAIEPSFYFYKRTPRTTSNYPIEGKLVTFEIALIPMLRTKLSKKMILDFKLIPNMLFADFGGVKELNPTLPKQGQWGSRDYALPELNVAFSVLLRYQLREAKRPKRRG